MSVKLIWITPSAESHIARIARVSSPQNQDNPNYEKLLSYCIKNNHVSIFEMANMCIEIKCSRSISRQILRHKSFNFQEFSQRYQSVADEPIFVEARMQDTKNRQSSTICLDESLRDMFGDIQDELWSHAYQSYETALKAGIAKECARALLPEGMSPSTFYMNGNIRSWISFLEVRLFGPGVQKECRDVAREVFKIFKENFPTICSAKGWI